MTTERWRIEDGFVGKIFCLTHQESLVLPTNHPLLRPSSLVHGSGQESIQRNRTGAACTVAPSRRGSTDDTDRTNSSCPPHTGMLLKQLLLLWLRVGMEGIPNSLSRSVGANSLSHYWDRTFIPKWWPDSVIQCLVHRKGKGGQSPLFVLHKNNQAMHGDRPCRHRSLELRSIELAFWGSKRTATGMDWSPLLNYVFYGDTHESAICHVVVWATEFTVRGS